MPFTLAHPVAVLPLKWLKKDRFSATGLVVGSMAPDYEYFMQQQHTPTISETTLGIFLFDLPLAIVVALVFHLLVKKPLYRHLPSPYDLRYSGFADLSFLNYLGRHWLVFSISLLIGIGSHLLLDWSTNPAMGPFAGTFLTKEIELGPLSERPLLLLERLFDGLGTLALGLFLLGLSKPGLSYAPATAWHKLLYWAIFLSTVLAIMAWEWKEQKGFEGFGVGITTFIWALVGGLVTASVMIRPIMPHQ